MMNEESVWPKRPKSVSKSRFKWAIDQVLWDHAPAGVQDMQDIQDMQDMSCAGSAIGTHSPN